MFFFSKNVSQCLSKFLLRSWGLETSQKKTYYLEQVFRTFIIHLFAQGLI